MKKIVPIITLLFTVLSTQAQVVSDSITVYVDNRVEMTLIMDDYARLKNDSTIGLLIQNFQKHIEAIKDELLEDKADLVYYKLDSLISVEPGDDKVTYLLNDGKLVNTGIRDKAILSAEKVKIIILTKNLASISELKLYGCLESTSSLLPEKSKVSQSLYFQCNDGVSSEITYKSKTTSFSDALELSMGAGANLVKNRWMGDLTIALDISLQKKGRIKHDIYLSTNLLYDFPGDNKMYINTFLNLGYRWNVAGPKDKARLIGAEFGILLDRQGEAFHKSTYRIAMNSTLSSGLTISPQLYLENDFKRIFPGVRIGFGL